MLVKVYLFPIPSILDAEWVRILGYTGLTDTNSFLLLELSTFDLESLKLGQNEASLYFFFQSKNTVNYADDVIIAKNVIILALRNFIRLSCKFASRFAYPRNLNIRKLEGSNLWSHSLWDWLSIRNLLQLRKQPLGYHANSHGISMIPVDMKKKPLIYFFRRKRCYSEHKMLTSLWFSWDLQTWN